LFRREPGWRLLLFPSSFCAMRRSSVPMADAPWPRARGVGHPSGCLVSPAGVGRGPGKQAARFARYVAEVYESLAPSGEHFAIEVARPDLPCLEAPGVDGSCGGGSQRA